MHLHNTLCKDDASKALMTIVSNEVEAILPSDQMALCKIIDEAIGSPLETHLSMPPWKDLAAVPVTTIFWTSMKLRLLAHVLTTVGIQCCMCKTGEVAHKQLWELGMEI